MCSASSKHPHSGVERFRDGEKASKSPLISPKPQRLRARRVLYPPGVRKIMPKEESDPARRWLFLLSALLFLQIYMEEGLCDIQTISDQPQAQDDHCMLEENPFTQGNPEADVAQCWGIEQSCNLHWEMRSCFWDWCQMQQQYVNANTHAELCFLYGGLQGLLLMLSELFHLYSAMRQG